jgi:hypothetical protein
MMGNSHRFRPGFARLLPLLAFTGLPTGTVSVLARVRPVQSPKPAGPRLVRLNNELQLALWCFDAAAARSLVLRGADPKTRVSNRLSPLDRHSNFPTVLMLAASLGDERLVRELLTRGVSVDGDDGDGWTPLMIASALGDARVAKALLSHGAKVNRGERLWGTTALQLALGARRGEVASLLRRAGAHDPPRVPHYLIHRLGVAGEVAIPHRETTVTFGKDSCVEISGASCCIGHRTCPGELKADGVTIHLRGGLFLIEY